MRTLVLLLAGALPALTAQAGDGTHIILARQCVHVTGDDAAYQRALEMAPARLTAGGMSEAAADAWLADALPRLEGVGPPEQTHIGSIDICRDLLPKIEADPSAVNQAGPPVSSARRAGSADLWAARD